MTIFKAGLAAAAVFIGAVAALLGAVVLLSSLGSGTIAISYGTGATAAAETIARTTNPERFWMLLGTLGLAPLVLGILAAVWGGRTLRG